MKKFIIGLVGAMTFSMGSIANADVFGEDDDTYAGFQVTIPIDVNRAHFLPAKNEYSFMVIGQNDGIRDGIALTRDINGTRTIGYLRPSQTFEIGRSRISDYTIPVMSLNQETDFRSDFSGGGEIVFGLVVGIAFAVKLIEYAAEEIEDCTDPNVDSEAIAGC